MMNPEPLLRTLLLGVLRPRTSILLRTVGVHHGHIVKKRISKKNELPSTRNGHSFGFISIVILSPHFDLVYLVGFPEQIMQLVLFFHLAFMYFLTTTL